MKEKGGKHLIKKESKVSIRPEKEKDKPAKVEEPIAFAAWITPKSTSFNEVSIILATKGAAATDKGTTVAAVPIVFPTINLERGNNKIIKMIKGNERNAFTIRVKIWNNTLRGFIPDTGSLIHNKTPNGKPKIKLNTVDSKTIKQVCPVAGKTNCNILIISDI